MNDRRVRPSPLAVMALCAALAGGSARAQQPPTQQQYEDALRQLQQSQDRKNQLADENAKLAEENAQLKARIAELESALRAAEASERTYFLRAHYAAWQTFMERYPLLLNRFQSYLNTTNTVGLTTATSAWVETPPVLFDAEWPFGGASGPTTNGATQ